MYASASTYVVDQLKQLSDLTTAQPKIDKTGLKQIKIICPTILDQQEIINYLNSQTSKIEQIILKIKSQIEKLQEFKQSLISSCVTGKIDVRDTIA